MGLRQFVRNLRYLARYDIKNIINDLTIVKNGQDFLKFEIIDDLKSLRLPKILSNDETVDYLVKTDKSIARFGDGEVSLLRNISIPFQSANPLLAERLMEVLTSPKNNIVIGITDRIQTSTRDENAVSRDFLRSFWGENAYWFIKQLDLNYTYMNARFTILPESEEKIDNIRNLWRDNDITVIAGDRVFKNIRYNIFDCAKSIEYIYAPTIDAFNVYDEIFKKARTIDKNRLVCIILGPTATVLAYDLAQLGYRALDLGHIVKSYDLYCKNNKRVDLTPEERAKFFAKD